MNEHNDAREYRKNVWLDTVEKCTKGKFKDLPTGQSYLFHPHDKEFSNIKMTNKFDKTNVIVVNADTLVTAKTLNDAGASNVLVLNMASWLKRGGGVETGCSAQEEELFRRSNYFMSYDNRFHPLKKGEAIYTPKVTIIKDQNYNDLTAPFKVSMLAIAALKNPNLTNENKYTDYDLNTMSNIIENIFRVSYLMNHDVLVLGALGCGAYYNPPEEVVKIFNTFLTKYDKMFKIIVFAVLSNEDENFNIFDKNIKRL